MVTLVTLALGNSEKICAPRSGSLILLANVLQDILHRVLRRLKAKIPRYCIMIDYIKDYFRQQYHLSEIAFDKIHAQVHDLSQ